MARIAWDHSKPMPIVRDLKQRACLRCDRAFLSEGPYHRLCQACRKFLATSPWLTDEYAFDHLASATGRHDED